MSNGQSLIFCYFVLLLLSFVPIFGKQGRNASILRSVDEEYMQQEAIIKSVQWTSNMKGGEVFQEEHVWVLLGILRASDHTMVSESAESRASRMDADEFEFVPQIRWAV